MGDETHRVAPFGDLRVRACSAAHRSFSQLYHVLHRLLAPRHPPKALSSLTAPAQIAPNQRSPSLASRPEPATRALDATLTTFALAAAHAAAAFARYSVVRERALRWSGQAVMPHQLDVELDGLEPTTSALQRQRSTS